MKISLALGARRPISRQTAWGCLTTNLAAPGFGSLVAGRIAGYPQAALALGGVAMTTLLGVRFIVWSLANWSRLHDPQAESLDAFGEMWRALRWPLLGIAIFALGWLWALGTSLQILSSASKGEGKGAPPLLR
jgi:hypothetical protein